MSELLIPLAVLAASGTMTWLCCVSPSFSPRSAAASGERSELPKCCATGAHVPDPAPGPGDTAASG